MVAEPSGKRCVRPMQQGPPARHLCARSGLLVCASGSTRARIRGPSHACVGTGQRGGAPAPPPLPSPSRARHVPPLSGGRVALCLGSRRRPSAPDPGSKFNAPARALPFLFFFSPLPRKTGCCCVTCINVTQFILNYKTFGFFKTKFNHSF